MMRRFRNLPKEILLEILIRLPTESVLECKLVCKLWRDLVRQPSFSQLHLTHLNSADDGKLGFMILSHEVGSKSYYAEYDEHFNDTRLYSRETSINNINPLFENLSFIGSCNGLLCFHSWRIHEKFGKIQDGLTYVCNPVTREYIILPDLERQYSWWYWFGNFGYSCWWYGFGYSSSTNEYKFVSICKSTEDLNVRIVEVYTLGSGWRTVGKMDKNMKLVWEYCGAFANGALHWVDEAGTVLSFSLNDEKFSEIPLPPPSLTRDAVPYSLELKALCGFLGAVFDYDLGHIEIWLLKKNKDNYDLRWSKEFTFSSRIQFPFGFTKSGRLLCYMDQKIYRFDSKASSAKLDLSFGKSVGQAIPHKNTLVSLKVLGEKHTKIMEFGERLRSSEETLLTEEAAEQSIILNFPGL